VSGDLFGPGISREEADQLASRVLALASMTSDQADELLATWRARLDEDETTAKAATPGPWRAETHIDNHEPVGVEHLVSAETRVVAGTGLGGDQAEADAAHIARHDPARARRAVPAKWLVLDEHLPIESIYGLTCKRCVSWQDAPLAEGGETEFGIAIPDPWPCVPVRAVAASWDA
jgi:hypothetical protein